MSLDRYDKQALLNWDEFRQAVINTTTVDINETKEQQKKRIAHLEANDEEWFKHYFPKFYKSDPAAFHTKSTRRIMNNAEWYEVRAWSRELAKSTRSMMEDLKLLLTKKKRYKLLISNSYDNACRLLMPYKINLESNNRIIHDYGSQEKLGSWTDGDFTTRTGFSIRALGAGQSPRGTRKDEQRPDIIEFDDFDTDEECLNQDIIEKKWKWVNEAAIPTRSVSVPTLIRWNGNLIAEDCCIARAQEYADHVDVINIRDADGKSTWPSKNTEEHIDRVLSQISFEAQQKEYYNNPHTTGKAFKEMVYGKCPPLKELPFVVVYADPSTSNNDKPGLKSKAKNSCKAVWIVGYKDLKYYVYTGFLAPTTNAAFVEWLYVTGDYVKNKTLAFTYIENNSLQDPFYQQVLKPLIFAEGKKRGSVLPVTPDERDKPDKWFRIEGNLEPLNRNGQLILNEAEKENPHMKLLEAHFKSAGPRSKTMDGPDAVEGAVHIIKNKVEVAAAGGIHAIKRKPNSKRF